MSYVSDAKLPAQSILHDRVAPSDFLDCYSVKSTIPAREAAEIITDFPGWTNFLMRIRKAVTTPFGLLNENPTKGDAIGIFPIEAETNTEVLAGFNDKHLDFRVSVMSVDGYVFFATWVHPHNIGGKIYLKTIMPFHILICRNALARVHAADVRRIK